MTDEKKDTLAPFAVPHTADDTRLTVSNTRSPGAWWYPTRAKVIIDGVDYQWNSRAHRKLRHPTGPASKHPAQWWRRIGFLGYEPAIITWWNISIGVIADTLWVVNGVYATWPEQARSDDAATNIV